MSEENRTKKLLLTYGTLILLIAGLGIYGYSHSEKFLPLTKISLEQLLILFGLNFLFYAVNGKIISCFLKIFKIDLPFKEQYSLSVITTFGNYYIPFRGGAALRAFYLKSRYAFQYSKFLSAMAAQLLIVLGVAGFGLFLFSLEPLIISDFREYQLTLLGFLVFITSLVPMFIGDLLFKFVRLRFLRKILILVYRGWKMICQSPENLIKIFCYSFLSMLITGMLLYFEFNFLNIRTHDGALINIFDSLFLSIFNVLSSILIFTPGALGIRESVMMSFSQFVSIAPADVLVASVLDRAVNIVFITASFFLAAWILDLKNLKKNKD